MAKEATAATTATDVPAPTTLRRSRLAFSELLSAMGFSLDVE